MDLKKTSKKSLSSLLSLAAMVIAATTAFAADPAVPVRGLVDLRTTYSDGDYDVDTLVKMARERGFSVVIVNDHDRLAMEYGIAPLRNVMKRREEKNSINLKGASSYLDSIREAGEKYPDMVVIAGTESAPFYYWTGSPAGGDLTAWNYERRILTVGLERAEDYENLPVVNNGVTTRFLNMALPGIGAFLAALLAGAMMIRWKGLFRAAGIAIVVFSLLFIANSNPFRSSPFDPYEGDPGIAPWQLLIDDVHARGGLTFWNYPETRSGIRELGPIKVHTAPYPQALDESKGYTGFAALYGDTSTITEPGELWDRLLSDYCKGYRPHPVWGIATADYHKEGDAGETLGNFQTGFFADQLTRKDILEALKTGRVYAYRGQYPRYARLDEFSVSSEDGDSRAISGGQVVLKGNPVIRIRISSDTESKERVAVRLIRSGDVVKVFEGTLPMKIDYEDDYFKPGERVFYRMDMQKYGTLVSNPIFVDYRMNLESRRATGG
ncbi:MAG TPA: hypothetical protein VMB77_10505 [Syntrophales bacterium]|nr:hypothetical protein [Syntrophales bacterium]